MQKMCFGRPHSLAMSSIGMQFWGKKNLKIEMIDTELV